MSEKLTVGPEFASIKPPTTEFDGWTFWMPMNNPMIVPFLYLAAKARRGDELAAAVLTGSKSTSKM